MSQIKYNNVAYSFKNITISLTEYLTQPTECPVF